MAFSIVSFSDLSLNLAGLKRDLPRGLRRGRGIEDIVLCAHFFGEGTYIVDVLLYAMKNILLTIKLEKT